jgi:hypothetical protein
LSEIDHAQPITRADGDSAAGLAHQLITKALGKVFDAQVRKCSIPQGHGCRRELILLEARDLCKVAEFGERIGQPGNGWLRQIRTGSNLLIAEKSVIGAKCTQDIEAASQRDDETAICRHILGRTFHTSLELHALVARPSLTSDVLQNNPPCQDVELNFAVRN